MFEVKERIALTKGINCVFHFRTTISGNVPWYYRRLKQAEMADLFYWSGEEMYPSAKAELRSMKSSTVLGHHGIPSYHRLLFSKFLHHMKICVHIQTLKKIE